MVKHGKKDLISYIDLLKELGMTDKEIKQYIEEIKKEDNNE